MVTVILGGLAVWFGVQAHTATSQPSAQNVALTDTAATSQVNGEIASAVNTAFSYNYADMARTRDAARRLLTGGAVRQYNSLFKTVVQDASKDKLVLTPKVTSSGVELLSGDRARVLLFATQADTSAVTRQTSNGATMLAIDAIRQGGTWKIDGIDTFNGGA